MYFFPYSSLNTLDTIDQFSEYKDSNGKGSLNKLSCILPKQDKQSALQNTLSSKKNKLFSLLSATLISSKNKCNFYKPQNVLKKTKKSIIAKKCLFSLPKKDPSIFSRLPTGKKQGRTTKMNCSLIVIYFLRSRDL